MDIVEFNSRDKEIMGQIKNISSEAKPEDCYTCLKCTNGCPASKIFEEFAPHKIQIAAHLGMVEDLIESGILWYCFNCLTCQTRCPMKTSPVQTIQSLNNIAVNRGVKPPKAFPEMIKNISKTGSISTPREVSTTDFDFISREDLDLPEIGVEDVAKFAEALKVVGLDQILNIKNTEETK